MREEKPFIHLFKTVLGNYIYDVNTNKILKVPQKVYKYFEKNEAISEDIIQYINMLKAEGYLKSKRVINTENPSTELLPYYLKSKINYLILQVTRQCNLRCEYCVYSGGYKTRMHSSEKMEFALAKKGIDYLIEHSTDCSKITVGFYGGEPLLEFELMKKCVDYVYYAAAGKDIEFSITTNGTLLTDEVINFMIDNNFRVCVSLDGPKYIHDKNRRYAQSGKGSFDTVIKNLKRIKEIDADFYNSRVVFSTVLTTESGFECVSNYFNADELLADNLILASNISEDFSKEKVEITDRFVEEYNYERFKLFLALFNRIELERISNIIKKELDNILRYRIMETKSYSELPDTWHHGGPCVAGVHSLFMNVNGEFYPCEKVCEVKGITSIGNIKSGIDRGKVEKIINIEKYTEDKCHNCWAYAYCGICIQCSDGKEENLCDCITNKCSNTKNKTEEIFKIYCTLKEVGYDFGVREMNDFLYDI